MDKEELERLHAALEKLKEQLQAETRAAAADPLNVPADKLKSIEALRVQKANIESLLAAGKEAGPKPAAGPTAPAVPGSVPTPAAAAAQQQQHAGGAGGNGVPVVTRDAPEHVTPFKTFGEQLCAIAKGLPDERLDRVNKIAQEHAASGMGEAVPSNGGFMVQRDFVGALVASGYDQSKLAGKCRKIPLGPNSNGVSIPYIDETSRATGSRNGGVQIYWANEADSATPKKPKIGLLKLDLGKLIALAYSTDELLEDAPAMGSIIADSFKKEFAFVIDDDIIRANGAGKLQGILEAAALVTVSKEGGQAADTLMTQNVVKMFAYQINPANAEWYINQALTIQLPQMVLTAGASAPPLYMPPGGLSAAPLGTLYGRPINIMEQCSAIGDVGDIMFLDLSAYGIIDKGEMKAATSMHVRFLNDEQTFKFTYRVGGGPLVKTAKTAYKGAITPSPFVTLEAR